jgi:hypothetical protein
VYQAILCLERLLLYQERLSAEPGNMVRVAGKARLAAPKKATYCDWKGGQLYLERLACLLQYAYFLLSAAQARMAEARQGYAAAGRLIWPPCRSRLNMGSTYIAVS